MKRVYVSDAGYKEAAREAASVIRDGGIVLYPTDTLYGLAVDIHNVDALSRLYALKQRSVQRTALIAVPSIEAIVTYGQVPSALQVLIDRFLPGPLTFVLPAVEGVPKDVIRDDGTIGIRMPSDEFCLALNSALESPYTSTSANLSDMPTGATVDEILLQFGDSSSAVDLVIDDGPRAGGKPSTIISCVNGAPQILREGALSREELGIA